ncbi:hypothetical protein RRG08_019743 [Elysia crispata]|uniref:Uncharacterized protein n=1 Tax=Elysia crispata TaxID=231223 RepID=A0AAE0Y749_9GAST|nr:hypothetical protein RRG08_019743 [Elysia crispata]
MVLPVPAVAWRHALGQGFAPLDSPLMDLTVSDERDWTSPLCCRKGRVWCHAPRRSTTWHQKRARFAVAGCSTCIVITLRINTAFQHTSYILLFRVDKEKVKNSSIVFSSYPFYGCWELQVPLACTDLQLSPPDAVGFILWRSGWPQSSSAVSGRL